MTAAARRRQSWIVAGGITSLVACQILFAAGDGSANHPTARELREGYVGTVFSRLPDRTHSSWMVRFPDLNDAYGVSHVEDRGVEMLWLESTLSTGPDNPQPKFKVVDVLALPPKYKTDGLVVMACRGGAPGSAVVGLSEAETRKEIRAWTIDFTTGMFVELVPATGKCAPLFIREVN